MFTVRFVYLRHIHGQQALAETARRAKELELSVAMAPEGTRSKTGQLGAFKKVSVLKRSTVCRYCRKDTQSIY